MKKFQKILCLALSALMLLGNTVAASAATNTDEFEYLKSAIETVNSIPESEIEQFIEDNQEWIDEIGERLDAYLENIPEDEQNDEVTKLMGGNPLSRSGNLDKYFKSTKYHKRGGYWTYTMSPKWGVRLWGPTMKAGWEELGKTYSGIRNDNGSLWNQYRCHWDYDVFGLVAGEWDLEEGRPVIAYSGMFAALCNP